MSVQVVAQQNFELIEDLAAYADGFGDMVAREGDKLVDANRGRILSELRTNPDPVQYPIEWHSERQRKAFFATDGFGAGIPYQRTGQYENGWFVNTSGSRGTFSVSIGNRAPHAQFVGGSLNQRSVREARRYQQRFHRNTGWPLAVETVDFWLEAIEDELEDELIGNLNGFISRASRRRRSQIR